MKFDEDILSQSPEDTHQLAAELLMTLKPGAVLALHGDLGAGKTCFVQGLALALGIQRPVNSPTFTIINEYPGPLALYHIDLYRINSPHEALAMGLDEYLHGTGVTAVEWAERAGDLMPPTTIHVRFTAGAKINERILRFEKGRAGK